MNDKIYPIAHFFGAPPQTAVPNGFASDNLGALTSPTTGNIRAQDNTLPNARPQPQIFT